MVGEKGSRVAAHVGLIVVDSSVGKEVGEETKVVVGDDVKAKVVAASVAATVGDSVGKEVLASVTAIVGEKVVAVGQVGVKDGFEPTDEGAMVSSSTSSVTGKSTVWSLVWLDSPKI